RLVALLAWVEVFQSVDLDEFRKIFPVDPPGRDFGWALRVAQQFTRLQHTLVESGLLLSDVPVRAGAMFAEAERWEQIARLEQLHAERLAVRGFRDRHAVRVEAGARATRSSKFAPNPAADLIGLSRIVILGVPDPQPLALTVLAAWSKHIPVEVVVFAPASESAAFDEWGQPVSAVWSERILEISEFEKRVHLCADPASQASRVVAALRSYQTPADIVAVGVADVDVLAPIEGVLRHTELPTFNPEGRRRKGDALYQLLSALAELAAEGTFANVETLARCPDFLRFLETQSGPAFSSAGFLQCLDRLHTQYLPSSLEEARRHAPDSGALQVIARLRDLLAAGNFAENASTALAQIFEARNLDTADPADVLIVEAAGAWTKVLGEVLIAAESFREITPEQWWHVALQMYGETVHYDDKPLGAIELQGWLELLWEDAPHLVVCGLNDGRLPEAVVGDPFLPESLRESLGLKTNAQRFARDAYLLQALAGSRASSGRLDLLLGKTSTAGDPLRPSRLLLRCADSELPQRVEFLFKAADVSGSDLAWRRAWKLNPRRVPVPKSVAVTALRAWLTCPFRFYLERVLRMKSVDPEKTELDVLDFGTLCHTALEAMGRSAVLRECTDASVLREFLLGALEDEANRRFGANLTLPLVVQLESARQRLSRAAEVQAETRAEGWVIQTVEAEF
ncbi:MAG TPA: PD-(D/E)XK nuclease family protein, partial [Opitutus sp.]|nr:PD-(D/E)XK nuclease family protein [Opitutus sp.]